MKKLVALVVILAVAVPSMAATTVSCAQVPSTTNFTISYNYDSTGSFPRAFALDVTTSLGTISGVTATKTGESTSASKGFGIFPGTIVIDESGSVTNVGTPVAPASDPGALGGIGTAGATLELGSLYTTGGQPDASGVLVTVALSGVGAGQTATVTIVPNTTRGGVVLEDATSVGAFTSTCAVAGPILDCFSNALSTYARWTLSGKPACWCPPTSVTGAPAGGTGYQCVGDAAQDRSSAPYYYRVYTTDLTALSSSWKLKVGQTGYNACADVAHDQSSAPYYYGVYTTDLTRVSGMWKKTDAQLNTILGVGGSGGFCGTANVPVAYR